MAQKVENIVFISGLDYVKQGAAAINMKLGVAVAPGANATISSWWGTTNVLAVTTISSADLVITPGTSSVVLTVAGKAGIALQSTGTADTVAIFSTASSYVYAFTTCAQQSLGSLANTVTLSSWTITLTN